MAHLIANIKQKYFDANGEPLNGGKLFTYQAGTSTPLVTYQNKDESTQNTNPIILDANGEANIWLGANSYKFVMKDSLDNILWTVDDVAYLNNGSVVTSKLADGVLSNNPAGRAKMADGFLSADTTGRAKMADGFLSANEEGLAKMADGFLSANEEGLAKMADGFLQNTDDARAKMADGFLSADTTGRAKMADGFINSSKLSNGAVTPSKLSSLNKTLSSSCGTFASSTGSFQAVTNLSCAITTNGRAVQISLQPDGDTSSASSLQAFTGNDSLLRFKRGSTVIALYSVPVDVVHGPSSYSFFDEPVAGTYTYTVEISTVGGGTFTIYNTKLLVREI